MRVPARKPRAQDHIRPVICNWSDHPLQISWIVFKVGILNGYDMTAGMLESGLQRCSFTPVAVVAQNGNFGVLLGNRFCDFIAIVRRTIINDYNLQSK